MVNAPEGWINRIDDGSHKYVNIVPEDGKEPIITYFDTKKIYLPFEQEKYELEVLKKGENVIWLGITGWTKPPKHYPERYGTSNEDKIYETLASTLLIETILELKKNNIVVDLRHGASDAGVDASTMRVMDTIPVTGSGVNCPLYMPWVSDNLRGGPVLVAENKNAYHEIYSKYNQILIVTGGRDVAFYHDYLCRLKGDGYSIVADLIQTVSKQIVPGSEKMSGLDKNQMNNAAAFIREKNSFNYNPIPRSFEELSLLTRLCVLDNSYKLLKWDSNKDALSNLENKLNDFRKNNKIPSQITKDELEYRIIIARNEYLNLL
jgi:hypothetical protein